ncbi:hypothetical protein GQ55_6G282800 [Panicum hallii var. hallii]|uniref:F-box domain-containing protein n=1 Tax=Panicum hallii var. hallii TaxID=1504633 RepID=A0A2T7DAI0_9POAL|nr:hypothetical protein GQ55_6G282800 [Panicum hallii var. hallii]
MDRISALPDELLHVILGFVGDALAVTRTAALSRRWRHVWVHAKSLTIDAAAPGRFVDWVLARRADEDMGSLQIRMSPQGRRTSPEQANGWLRYAARRVVGSFVLLPADPVRATSIEMDLSNRTLRLPPASAAATYDSLTELPALLDCLASVRRLKGISVDMHGKYHRATYVGLWLMENCHGLEHVSVRLRHGDDYHGDELLDLTSEAAAPIVNVTSVVFLACDLVASVSSLLMRCPRLRSLRAEVDYTVRVRLETLEEVDITGFTGAAEEMQLLSLLFQSSDSVKRVTLRGGTERMPKTISLKLKRAEEGGGGGGDDADTTTIGEQLMKIPSTDRGCWHFAKEVFTWMVSSTQ